MPAGTIAPPSPNAVVTALHIVEPTLTGHAGHCRSLVRALADAAPDTELTVWAARDAEGGWDAHGTLRPHFDRRWRRLQLLALYRRLLREGGKILLATAGTTDLVLARWAARPLPPRTLYCFVHWLGRKRDKGALLSAIARRQPALEILAPTAEVADFFRQCGFRTTLVPYPIDRAGAPPAAAPQPFRHLLVAGAARIDKGFAQVVDLVAEMQQRRLSLPIVVQASQEDAAHPDPEVQRQLERLRAIGYPALTLVTETLAPAAYRALFEGSIVVQPYRAADFRDRVSGVTLDALAAAAPVVVTAGTWMARLAEQHQAGLAVSGVQAADWLQAVQRVQASYEHHAQAAAAASAALQADHSARHLIDVVLERRSADPLQAAA